MLLSMQTVFLIRGSLICAFQTNCDLDLNSITKMYQYMMIFLIMEFCNKMSALKLIKELIYKNKSCDS